MKKLDPNAKVVFYINGVLAWIFILLIVTIPMSIALSAEGSISIDVVFLIIFFELVWSCLIPIPFVNWSYENYKYQLQEDRIYIEKGFIWKRYIYIPYERIQNVDIIRGPLARMFGLSDLQIQTAGSSTNLMIEGIIPAVAADEANKLRDEILAKVPGKKQGL